MICKEMAKVNIDDKIAQMRQDALMKIKSGQMTSIKPVPRNAPEIRAKYVLRINGDQYGNFIICKRNDCNIDVSACSECGVFRGKNDKSIYCDYNDSGISIMLDEDDI
jgi:hypothetical protein